MIRTKVNFWDGIAVLAVLLAAAFLFFGAGKEAGKTVLVVTPNGSTEYDLQTDLSFSVTSNGITLQIEISDGKAFVSSSDCPDGICLHSGKISKAGESILCAPAGVRIFVKGGNADVDFVAG